MVADRRGIGRPASEPRDPRRDTQRMRDADRGAQVADPVEHAGGHGQGTDAKAVQRRCVHVVEGEHRQLDVDLAGQVQTELPVVVADLERLSGAPGLDEGTDHRRRQQPAPLGHGVRVGAQARVDRHRRDDPGRRRVRGVRDRDHERITLPRTGKRELIRATVQFGLHETPQPGVVLTRGAQSSAVQERLREVVAGHRRSDATVAAMSDWFDTYGFAVVDDSGLVTGGYPLDDADVARLVERAGVTRVLNLCEDGEYEPGERESVVAAYASRAIVEERLGLVDFGDVLPGALERGVRIVVPWLQEGETVYVHCRAGWQRSATMAAGILAVHHGIEPDDALGRIKRRKPSAQPLHHQLEGLWRWWRVRQRQDEDPTPND